MKTKVIAMVVLLTLIGSAVAQKDKKWTDWTKKDAQKMLDDSPWAKTQTDTDTSQMMFSPTNTAGSSSRNADNAVFGAVNQSVNIKFHVRFYSARPIRQALARIMELDSKQLDQNALTKLHNFGELKSPDSVIVTVTYESPDQRYSGIVMQAFNSAVTSVLKNDVYLQRAVDGKQLFLEEYVPPGGDHFGARFIFPREVNGAPFIDSKSGEIHFYAKYPNGIKVDRRFKVSEMMYEGELEF
jgi:hypothetical protein